MEGLAYSGLYSRTPRGREAKDVERVIAARVGRAIKALSVGTPESSEVDRIFIRNGEAVAVAEIKSRDLSWAGLFVGETSCSVKIKSSVAGRQRYLYQSLM